LRTLIANLDCELAWARDNSPGPHKSLPPPVRRAVSEFSQSLRVFTKDDDQFLTISDLETTPAETLRNADAVLAWGQTTAFPSKPCPADPRAPWQERLWQLACDSSVAAACNDRSFAIGLPLDPALELPGLRMVSTLQELDAFLETAPLGPDDAWVAKAPWSASGREKLKRRGRAVLGEQRAFVTRLLRRYEKLLVEPWMQRTADIGVAGLVGEALETSLIFPAHQLLCDAGGVFRGIRIDDEQTRGLLGVHGDALMDSARTTLEALHARGYRGPFGIDSFLYESHGTPRLRAVCEINARMSFGHVARATAEASGQATCDFAPGC